MWKKINFSKVCFMLALLCLSFLSVGFCSESRTYEISEEQLTTLEAHLNALEANNSELLNLLNASEMDLTEASLSLSESKKELETLRAQLTALQAETKQLDASLRTANNELQNARISFRESEKEHDRIEGRLRTQRNIWEILCFLAVGTAIAK